MPSGEPHCSVLPVPATDLCLGFPTFKLVVVLSQEAVVV